MSQDIATRKIVELKQKLANLDSEFCHWLNQSGEGEHFEKHNLQIRVVTTILAQLHAGAWSRRPRRRIVSP